MSMLIPSEIPYDAQPGFARTFAAGRLTLGLVFPIDSSYGRSSEMRDQVTLAQQAENAGFAALWVRDIPLFDPSFGDLGQIFEPLVYLSYIAGQTKKIALGTFSIVLPIRNPLHLAKAATSVDQLSNGRLILGVASGDRPLEYPAFGLEADRRGEIFREHFQVLRQSQQTSFEPLQWSGGSLIGADLVPKSVAEEIPLLVTGNSRQSLEWIASNGHGWISYPRSPVEQKKIIGQWRLSVEKFCGQTFKPFTQSLDIDLAEKADTPPQSLHLGYRLGRSSLIELLILLQQAGVNHVGLNLRFGKRPASEVLQELTNDVIPIFPAI